MQMNKPPIQIIKETIIETIDDLHELGWTSKDIADIVANKLYNQGYYSLWKPKEMEK